MLGSAIHSFSAIHSMVDLWYTKDGYNQGYLATVKMNEKYILKIKRKKK